MPFPRWVARLNKRYTNRFIEPVVSLFGGFVVVGHRGRNSGAYYETPLFGFDYEGSLLVALTYGAGADWAQNVLAGGGWVQHGSRQWDIAGTALVGREEAWPFLPLPVRGALRAMRVQEFMVLRVGEGRG